jgi:hypothetical protein
VRGKRTRRGEWGNESSCGGRRIRRQKHHSAEGHEFFLARATMLTLTGPSTPFSHTNTTTFFLHPTTSVVTNVLVVVAARASSPGVLVFGLLVDGDGTSCHEEAMPND